MRTRCLMTVITHQIEWAAVLHVTWWVTKYQNNVTNKYTPTESHASILFRLLFLSNHAHYSRINQTVDVLRLFAFSTSLPDTDKRKEQLTFHPKLCFLFFLRILIFHQAILSRTVNPSMRCFIILTKLFLSIF